MEDIPNEGMAEPNTSQNLNSVLKPPKPRVPLKEIMVAVSDEDTTVARKRRVSFANVNKIKEFSAGAESLVVCHTPAYEEPFSLSSDSGADGLTPAKMTLTTDSKEFSANQMDLTSCLNNYPVSRNSLRFSSGIDFSSTRRSMNSVNYLDEGMDLTKAAFCANQRYSVSAGVDLDNSDILKFTEAVNEPKLAAMQSLNYMDSTKNILHCSNNTRYSVSVMDLTKPANLQQSFPGRQSTRYSMSNMDLTEVVDNSNDSCGLEFTEVISEPKVVAMSTRYSLNDMDMTEAVGFKGGSRLSTNAIENLECSAISDSSMDLTKPVYDMYQSTTKCGRTSMAPNSNMELTGVIGEFDGDRSTYYLTDVVNDDNSHLSCNTPSSPIRVDGESLIKNNTIKELHFSSESNLIKNNVNNKESNKTLPQNDCHLSINNIEPVSSVIHSMISEDLASSQMFMNSEETLRSTCLKKREKVSSKVTTCSSDTVISDKTINVEKDIESLGLEMTSSVKNGKAIVVETLAYGSLNVSERCENSTAAAQEKTNIQTLTQSKSNCSELAEPCGQDINMSKETLNIQCKSANDLEVSEMDVSLVMCETGIIEEKQYQKEDSVLKSEITNHESLVNQVTDHMQMSTRENKEIVTQNNRYCVSGIEKHHKDDSDVTDDIDISFKEKEEIKTQDNKSCVSGIENEQTKQEDCLLYSEITNHQTYVTEVSDDMDISIKENEEIETQDKTLKSVEDPFMVEYMQNNVCKSILPSECDPAVNDDNSGNRTVHMNSLSEYSKCDIEVSPNSPVNTSVIGTPCNKNITMTRGGATQSAFHDSVSLGNTDESKALSPDQCTDTNKGCANEYKDIALSLSKLELGGKRSFEVALEPENDTDESPVKQICLADEGDTEERGLLVNVTAPSVLMETLVSPLNTNKTNTSQIQNESCIIGKDVLKPPHSSHDKYFIMTIQYESTEEPIEYTCSIVYDETAKLATDDDLNNSSTKEVLPLGSEFTDLKLKNSHVFGKENKQTRIVSKEKECAIGNYQEPEVLDLSGIFSMPETVRRLGNGRFACEIIPKWIELHFSVDDCGNISNKTYNTICSERDHNIREYLLNQVKSMNLDHISALTLALQDQNKANLLQLAKHISLITKYHCGTLRGNTLTIEVTSCKTRHWAFVDINMKYPQFLNATDITISEQKVGDLKLSQIRQIFNSFENNPKQLLKFTGALNKL